MEAAVQSISSTEGNHQSNDYHQLMPTEKQIKYARHIAQRTGVVLAWNAQQDRHSLSKWIDQNKNEVNSSPFAAYPTSKQVGFAERLAHIKRREIPHECFKDKKLMSKWIDANR